jgi:murein L,D-transpeptidase YafK
MNWMGESDVSAFIVEKSRQKLSVWRTKNGEPIMVESYPCSIGLHNVSTGSEESGSPQGVFFLCSLISQKSLPQEFGQMVLVTDFPRPIDRMRGKRDEGIWLHGGEAPLHRVPSLRESISLKNDELKKVVRHVRLQSTPLIIVDQITRSTRAEIIEKECDVRTFVESWRKAWESKDLATYMKCYSPNFQSGNMDFKAWIQKRRELNQNTENVELRLGPVAVYSHEDLVTALFPFMYRNGSLYSSGIRILYISRSDGFKILGEDYLTEIEDSVPGNFMAGAPRRNKYRAQSPIPKKMTSLSKPDYSAATSIDIEFPRPSPSSIALVADKMYLSDLFGHTNKINSEEKAKIDPTAGEQKSRAAGDRKVLTRMAIAAKHNNGPGVPRTNRTVNKRDEISGNPGFEFLAHSMAAALYLPGSADAVQAPCIPLPESRLMDSSNKNIKQAR